MLIYLIKIYIKLLLKPYKFNSLDQQDFLIMCSSSAYSFIALFFFGSTFSFSLGFSAALLSFPVFCLLLSTF
jgi:hypothetical protein